VMLTISEMNLCTLVPMIPTRPDSIALVRMSARCRRRRREDCDIGTDGGNIGTDSCNIETDSCNLGTLIVVTLRLIVVTL